jgi:biopolymer transport protein ExbD
MAFVLTRRLQPVRGLIDLVPMVTVVLLLLLFFILSSAFVLQPGIKVEPPRSSFGVGTPASRLMVAVMLPQPQLDANGVPVKAAPVLFFNDQIVTMDGLSAALDQLPPSRFQPTLVLKIDKDITLDMVTRISEVAFAHHLSVIIATQPMSGAVTP